MATARLVATLEHIKTNLDVECTCHLHHGPLCPKRLAADALVDRVTWEAVRARFGAGAVSAARRQLAPQRRFHVKATSVIRER